MEKLEAMMGVLGVIIGMIIGVATCQYMYRPSEHDKRMEYLEEIRDIKSTRTSIECLYIMGTLDSLRLEVEDNATIDSSKFNSFNLK